MTRRCKEQVLPNRKAIFQQFDPILLISTVALITIGIFFVYSSSIDSLGRSHSSEYIKQTIFAIVGIVLLVAVSVIRYDLYRDVTWPVYLVALFLVGLTIVISNPVNGARSWLGIGEFGIQPSEFLKIGFILMLARYLERIGDKIKQIPYLLIASAFGLVPIGSILMQPDLGTAMVFIPIFLTMVYFAGAKIRHILFILSAILGILFFTLLPAWAENLHTGRVPILDIFLVRKLNLIVIAGCAVVLALALIGYQIFKRGIFYWASYIGAILTSSLVFSLAARFVLKEYQISRLIVFLNPYFDEKGTGWNIIQSITAIGSGGLSGKGFLQGSQSHLNYLPEQSTDFIFSILSEEWGFLGAVLVFGLFLTILIRILVIANKARDTYGTLLCSGVIGMFFFHLIINVGMTIGIMPITGIPLIFLSYGGSSLWVALLGVGICMNVNANRYQF